MSNQRAVYVLSIYAIQLWYEAVLRVNMNKQHGYELQLEASNTDKPKKSHALLVVGIAMLGTGLIVVVVGCVFIAQSSVCEQKDELYSAPCEFSPEATRAGLPQLLEEIKEEFFKHNQNSVAWKPDLVGVELTDYVKTRYAPYDPTPLVIQERTDASLALLKKFKNLNVNQDLLKPRESKVIEQASHFLKHSFGVPYDGNYYAGDWLLGPNYFCWQPICYLDYDINAYAHHAVPRSYDDMQKVIDVITNHKAIFERYRQNMELGVRAGMVRSSTDCAAGAHAFKDRYRGLVMRGRASAALDEFYGKTLTSSGFLENLEKGVAERWRKEKNVSVNQSVKDALLQGFAQPLLDFVHFLDHVHSRHCPPDSVTSGLSELPLPYVWFDDRPNKSQATTGKLPTGEPLDGKQTYRRILSFFTTTDISPEEIYYEGKQQLEIFMPQVINIAKEITKISNETAAIPAFQALLDARDQWHNNMSFPPNESDAHAYRTCVDDASARVFCPRRWEAMRAWCDYIMEVMALIEPKIARLFYFTGIKATTANCPIEMQPHYNPANGAMYFAPSDGNCTKPTHFGMPFFLKEYGPKFQEWSVTGHEARPGHHIQMQGLKEHFRDACGGVMRWLDKQMSFIAFQEGWALYAENPILSHDTNLYEDNVLQRYGMLKWQVWRAVRLVVDTGLHYRGMKRSEALEHFSKFTWDRTDFAVKEVTRYQSDPGQATAYMLGRLEIIKQRKKAEWELGPRFDLRDFHYQVLSQGSAPLTHLRAHIDRYIRCVKGQIRNPICSLILKTSTRWRESEDVKSVDDESRPPLPQRKLWV